jgi:predicted hotdog family 3-hydroxylacyl-ACP dehydratase
MKPLPPIEALLLQRSEMLLLDSLLDYGPEYVEVAASVRENHPLAQGARGLPAWVGIEQMAQAISVFSALELCARGLPPRIGLLLGTRDFRPAVAFFPAGARLQIRAECVLRDPTGLGVFDCTIHQEQTSGSERLLAQARVKGYMPDSIDELIEAGAYG